MWGRREGASLYRGEAGVKGIANPTGEVKTSNRDGWPAVRGTHMVRWQDFRWELDFRDSI